MRIYLFLNLFLVACFSISAQEKSNLELLDIYDYEYVSDPQISPDGERVIYVRNFKDIMTDKELSNLWIVNSDGSQNRPLTSGNHNDLNPRWSNDGQKLVFKSNMQDDKMKLFLMWLDSREIFPITNTVQSPGEVNWSNDGKQVAFTMFVPKKSESFIKLPEKPEGAKWNEAPIFIDKLNYRGDGQGYLKDGNDQIFVVSTNGGTPRQLTNSDNEHGIPVWSADDRKLYFSANLHENADLDPVNSEIYELEIATGKVNSITERQGPDSNPVVSPNDNTIAYLGFDDRYQGYQINDIYIRDANGTSSTLITGDFDRDIENIEWDGKGKGLYFQYNDQGKTKIGYADLKGNIKEIATGLGGLSLGRPYNAAAFSVSDNGDLAFTYGTTENPADLAILDGKKMERLTNLNEDLFSYRELGNVEEIRWKSSFDDRERSRVGW